MPLVQKEFSAYESIEVGDEAVGLSPEVCGDSQRALITVEKADIRYRLDGENPTASEGHSLSPTDVPLELFGCNTLQSFRAIKAKPGQGPILRVSYGS